MSKKSNRKVFKLIVFLSILYFVYAKAPSVIERFFPLEYMEPIMKYSKEQGVNPLLVAGLIKAESSFDADAISHAGAMGLMQIMPDTGTWIAGKMKMDGYEESMLLNPETNIEMGVWFLSYLLDQYENEKLALAAYNAGKAKVDGWLAEGSISADETITDDIPYTETKNYVEKINRFTKLYEKMISKNETTN